MSTLTIAAHFDGKQIQLDEPITLARDTRLLITVLPPADHERAGWLRVSANGLNNAYGPDEPDYGLDSIKVENPEYAGR